MSKESLGWLNTLVLVGFTKARGEAWHYQAELQGDEPNHYPDGPVPIEDVRRRLFAWEALSRDLYVDLGGGPLQYERVADRQAIVAGPGAPVPGEVFGVFKSGYAIHPYGTWLVENVETILDDTLQIGSAGLLRKGAQAWVSVEVPDNMRTPEGVAFRPQLIAATSLDGSLATTYKRSATIVVCDNTLAAGLSGAGERYRLKHTRYSTGKVAEAREALGIVYEIADDVSREIDTLLRVTVEPKQWTEVLDIMVPLTDSRGLPIAGRSLTMAENRRNDLINLYLHDNRVEPWSGTAFGVLQAYNTYQHHLGTVRGASRAQRNRSNAIGNEVAENDNAVIAALERVLDRSLEPIGTAA